MTKTTQTMEAGWTRRRFCIALAWVLALQIALLFILSKTGERTREPIVVQSPASFQMLAAPLRAGALAEMLVTDPTLFALPQEDSFSGVAWMKLRDTQHATAEWSESPQWLGVSSDNLARSFASFVRQGRKALLPVAEKTAPADSSPPPAELPALAPSRLVVNGEIASRSPANLPGLPTWQSSEPLDASTIDVGINAAGQVVSTRLSARSGLDIADQEALRLAAALVFAPASGKPVAWGRMQFVWSTASPNSTNLISPVSASR